MDVDMTVRPGPCEIIIYGEKRSHFYLTGDFNVRFVLVLRTKTKPWRSPFTSNPLDLNKSISLQMTIHTC